MGRDQSPVPPDAGSTVSRIEEATLRRYGPAHSSWTRLWTLQCREGVDRLGGSFGRRLTEAASRAARCRISSCIGYPVGTTPPATYRKELIYEFIQNMVRPCFYVV